VPRAAAAERADQGRGLAHLRRHGVDSLSDVRYVLYESKGELTIVPERGLQVPDPDLVRIALHETATQPHHPAERVSSPTDPAI
jgi:uncharacterized membrane protein YcaP (DUF421 family)